MGFVKNLSKSSILLNSIPSDYTFSTIINSDYSPSTITEEESIPIIDFSLLTSSSPQHRSQIVQVLGKACLEWGFFMVINHGIPEKLREEMLNSCQSFFDLSDDEKVGYAGKHVLDPIRCGTSFNASVEKVFFWRDFLKVFVHPEFNSPDKPPGFRETSYEYSKRTRAVARELLKRDIRKLGTQRILHGGGIRVAVLFPDPYCESLPSLPTARTRNGYAITFCSWSTDSSNTK